MHHGVYTLDPTFACERASSGLAFPKAVLLVRVAICHVPLIRIDSTLQLWIFNCGKREMWWWWGDSYLTLVERLRGLVKAAGEPVVHQRRLQDLIKTCDRRDHGQQRRESAR